MKSLVNGLGFIGALAVVMAIFVVWNLVVFAMLRSCGVDAHFRFREGRAQTDEALRRLGLLKYVVLAGILLFGWPLYTGLAAGEYIIDLQDGVSDAHLLRDFAIWTAGGILYGLISWKWDRPNTALSANSLR